MSANLGLGLNAREYRFPQHLQIHKASWRDMPLFAGGGIDSDPLRNRLRPNVAQLGDLDSSPQRFDDGFGLHAPLKHTLLSDSKHSFAMGGNHAFMTYGTRLNLAIKARKSTRKKLAKELEITVQAVGLVINNKTNAFTADNSARAARFLRVNSHWLATGLGEMFDATPVATQQPEEITHEQAFRYFSTTIPPTLTETKKEQVDTLFKRLVRFPEQVDEIADAFADLLKIGDRPTAPDQYSQLAADDKPFVKELRNPNLGESKDGDRPRAAPKKGTGS